MYKDIKIVSWNCGGAFRKKYYFIIPCEKSWEFNIETIDADIYIIQECENPKKYPKLFKEFCLECDVVKYYWTGDKDNNKGLGVFVKGSANLNTFENTWKMYNLHDFISINIDNSFDLIAVWTRRPYYIEEYSIFQAINGEKYNEKTVLMGDFNGNALGDSMHLDRGYSFIVEKLKYVDLDKIEYNKEDYLNLGIESAYHNLNKIKAGEEEDITFISHNKEKTGFYIDYCFLHPKYLKDFKILTYIDDFKENLSFDHYPIMVKIDKSIFN